MVPVIRRDPRVGKNVSFPFQIAVVCWVDLLGYGAMIAQADFNPLHIKAGQALSRLRHFHEIVAQHSGRHFPTLVMNDGAAAYRDLSLRSCSATHDFLKRAWDLFSDIKSFEHGRGFPGARMVIASGFRMRGRAGSDATTSHLKSVMQRYQDGKLGPEQAIREAATIRRTFDIVPQLQANFAFTKAYLAESDGSKAGLRGANCFVDLAMFDSPVPPWVVVDETVNWSHGALGMRASFARIVDLPEWSHGKAGPQGIKDGLQVAQHLAQNDDVLTALRAGVKP